MLEMFMSSSSTNNHKPQALKLSWLESAHLAHISGRLWPVRKVK